jgi:four helix bundle protein
MRNHSNDVRSSTPSADGGGAATSVFPFQRLDLYVLSRQLVVLVHGLDIRDAELRDQASRAVKSVHLNLSEGLPDDRGAMRRKYFLQADGSLHETAAAVDLAAAIGAIPQRRADDVLAVAGRVRAMLRGLLRAGRAP